MALRWPGGFGGFHYARLEARQMSKKNANEEAWKFFFKRGGTVSDFCRSNEMFTNFFTLQVLMCMKNIILFLACSWLFVHPSVAQRDSNNCFFTFDGEDAAADMEINSCKNAGGNTSCAQINFVRLTKDFVQDDRYGLRINAGLYLQNLRGKKCLVAAYIHHPNGDPVTSYDGRYESDCNDVGTFRDIYPSLDNSLFRDIQLFIPYHEIIYPTKMGRQYCYKVRIAVFTDDGYHRLACSNFASFCF